MEQALYLAYMVEIMNKHCMSYLNQERTEHVTQHGLVTTLTYPGSLADSFCEARVPLQQTAYASGVTHIHPVIAMETNTLTTQHIQSVLEKIG